MNKTRLIATERELLDPGYRQVYTPPGQGQLSSAQPSKLTGLKKGQRIHPQTVRTRRHPPPTPPAMHEAELIKALRTRKIGRPATYALIIETLLKRQYVTRDEMGKLHTTSRGQEVCDFLVQRFSDLCTYEFTSHMEKALDEIARGRRTYTNVIGELWTALHHEAKTETPKEKTT